MTTTRGDLKPGEIKNLTNGDVVEFMFNPQEYTISKTNTYEALPQYGRNVPLVAFQQGGARSISLKLYFDTLPKETSVRLKTAKLWKMMMIDSSTVSSKTNKGHPPIVAFSWGGVYLKALITSLSEQYILFSEKGVPLRSVVSISLQEYVAPSDSEAGSGTTEAGATVVQGSRIDNVAGTSWKVTAGKNGVTNPSKLPVGKVLKV